MNSNYRAFDRIKRSSTAFSLIEMLIVVALIVFLMAIVIKSSRYLGAKAMEAEIRNELKLIEAALEAYKADNGGYPPLTITQSDTNSHWIPVGGTLTVPVESTALNPIVPPNMGAINFNIQQFNPTVYQPTRWQINGWFNSYFIYRALCCGAKVYMNFPTNRLYRSFLSDNSYGDRFIILDASGNAYGYNPFAPVHNPQTFDLFSIGTIQDAAVGYYYPNISSSNADIIANWQRF